MKNIIIGVFLLLAIISNAQLEGTLNNQFSQDGWDASVYGNNNGFQLSKTIVQPDGKILICAEGNFSNEGSQGILIRYNTDGTIDTTFGGGDGMVRTHDDPAIGLYTRAVSMALLSNGKIILIGDVFYNNERIICLNPDGSLDTSFGIDGFIDMARPNSEYTHHVAVQSDDKIIVCGKNRQLVNGINEWGIFMWRFTSNGTLDTTFGNAGLTSYVSSQWVGIGEVELEVNDLIVLPDNKIVINQSFIKNPDRFVLLRKYNADGSIDNAFGSNGEVIKSAPRGGGDNYSSSAVQSDGSIISSITTGNTTDERATEVIYRATPQGIIDPSFNIDLGNPSQSTTYLQLIISAEKLYVIKKANVYGYGFKEITCFDLNGNPVTTFGDNGLAIVNQNDIPASHISTHSAIAPDGNIYLASYIQTSNIPRNYLFMVANVFGFNPNLSIENEVANNKIVVYPNPSNGIFSIQGEGIDRAKIDIISIDGRVLHSIEKMIQNDNILNVSGLNSGMYLLRIKYDSTVLSQKIIIN